MEGSGLSNFVTNLKYFCYFFAEGLSGDQPRYKTGEGAAALVKRGLGESVPATRPRLAPGAPGQ